MVEASKSVKESEERKMSNMSTRQAPRRRLDTLWDKVARQTAFLLHIVSFVAATGMHQLNQNISHLFDVRRCSNSDHLMRRVAILT